jgi:hypothetical protein
MKMSIPCLFLTLPIYSWTFEQIGRYIFLLLKTTQILVITICVALDQSTVIFFFLKENGYIFFFTGMLLLPIVKVDRNKYLYISLGNHELKTEQIRSDSF